MPLMERPKRENGRLPPPASLLALSAPCCYRWQTALGMAATLTRRTGVATTPAERLPQTQEKRYDAGEQAIDGDHILSRPGRSLKGKYQYDRKQRYLQDYLLGKK